MRIWAAQFPKANAIMPERYTNHSRYEFYEISKMLWHDESIFDTDSSQEPPVRRRHGWSTDVGLCSRQVHRSVRTNACQIPGTDWPGFSPPSQWNTTADMKKSVRLPKSNDTKWRTRRHHPANHMPHLARRSALYRPNTPIISPFVCSPNRASDNCYSNFEQCVISINFIRGN